MSRMVVSVPVLVMEASKHQQLQRGANPLTRGRPAPHRFQAVLSVRPGEATLQVVETTDFNQLPHVTLAFRPGSDAAVKAFLAGRLADVKAERAALAQQLSAATVCPCSTVYQLMPVAHGAGATGCRWICSFDCSLSS